MWKWFRRFYFSGTGGCLPERQACLAGCPVLYGPNIYCGLLPRDVCEMVGTWLCQIFHQCLVLAWFCHSYGRLIFIICKNEKIFFSLKLSRLGYETHYVLTFYTNILTASLFLVTDFSFDSYIYLCLFSLQLILVQIQIVYVKNWNCRNVFRLNFGRRFISLNITFISRKSLLIIDAAHLFIYLIDFIFFIQFIIWPFFV